MKSHSLLSVAACVAVMLLAFAYDASAAEKVSSERSTAPAQPALRWRSESFPVASVARLQYREMPVAEIYKVQRYNDTRNLKAEQIGIGRVAASAGVARTLPSLKWIALRDGSSVARIEVKSPVALAMRVGLDVSLLHSRAEIRFGGSDRPREVVAMMTGAEMRRIADAGGVAWTPATDGERQIIEVYLPPRVSRTGVKVQAPQVSHLLANSLNDFKILPKIGESAACNVDTACRVGELGANFVSAKNAVAHMVFNYFQANGTTVYGTFICSGTLLADTLTASQIPYFYSANHCFYGGEDGAPLQNLQTVANTLTTYWGYEATGCSSGVQAAKIPLAGGAAVLFADADTGTTTTTGTDAMLLRLNGTPPAGSEYAGWSSALLASGSNIIGIHHPKGDAKKVSSGQQVARDGYLTTVAWLSGTTEGGSSGSGLFTADGDGYHLRGGLYGGSASCANTGTVANTGNRDYYSRFDVIFPSIKQWLAPVSATPIRVNGSHPLIHSTAVPAAPAPASSAIPASATVPLNSRLPRIRAIRTGPFEP